MNPTNPNHVSPEEAQFHRRMAIPALVRKAAVPLVCLFGFGCSTPTVRFGGAGAVAIGDVMANLRPIDTAVPGNLTISQHAYLDYYDIRADRKGYAFGTFASGRVTLACQLSRASTPAKGTVILVHGYLDHAGCTRHLINRLASEGYNVAVYDQPGHGMSGGKRVSANDFSIYEAGFSDFLAIVLARMPAPYDVVAHSMGGTAVVDHLRARRDTPLRRVILLTPMIRDATPRMLRRFGHTISPLVDYLPRITENNSSDPGYPAWIKADPLQPRFVSTHWSRCFCRWQREVTHSPPSDWSPLVLYAPLETVIDAPFSRNWMQRTFPRGRSIEIEGARHQLLNEAEPIRDRVLDLICAELGR